MISIKKIQELRNITSLGIMECKEALLKANGDIDLAINNLYSKGTIKYTKKDASKLGFVNSALNEDKKQAIIIEFNTQTDFVSKNEQFLHFVNLATKAALHNSSPTGALTVRIRNSPNEPESIEFIPIEIKSNGNSKELITIAGNVESIPAINIFSPSILVVIIWK